MVDPHAIGVLLVGEVPLRLEGLAALLARDGRLRVAGVASVDNPGARTARADVIVVDDAARHGAESMRHLVGDAQGPIVVLDAPEDERQVIELAQSGVIGFTERDASIDDLVQSVVSAARGDASLPPRIATALLRRVTRGAAQPVVAGAGTLTVREREIVELIAESLSNKEIAARLCIELATVKNHVHNILDKLQVSRRSEAVARLRLVEPDDRGTRGFTPRSSVG